MISESRKRKISNFIGEILEQYTRQFESRNIWLAIAGTTLIISALAIVMCALAGITPLALWSMIDWPVLGSVIGITAVLSLGFALLAVAFHLNPDEKRAAELKEQEIRHLAELEDVRKEAYNDGFMAGQREGLNVRISESEIASPPPTVSAESPVVEETTVEAPGEDPDHETDIENEDAATTPISLVKAKA